MSERLQALRRIAALQAQRKRLAEWNLAALDRRRGETEAAQRALDGFMADGCLTGPLAAAALKQARRLAERAAVAVTERTRLAAALQAAERRHKLAERICETVGSAERAAVERRDLEQLMEAFLARSDALP